MKKLRKVMALVLVCMLLSACGFGGSGGLGLSSQEKNTVSSGNHSGISATQNGMQTVASSVDLAAMFELPDNVLPNLYDWSQGEASYDGEPSELDGNQVLYYWTEMDIVKEYVAMLQKNGYTLVDEYDEFSGIHSWGLICNEASSAGMLEMMFTDTPCHVSIHWTDSSRHKFTMYVSPDIQVRDTGVRRDGSVADILPQGVSAGAGLVRLADGSYQTSDGRLTTSIGNAMVIRDGTTYNTGARYCISDGGEQLWVEDYYRNEGIFLEFPENSLMEGDLFRREELMRWRPIEESKGSLDGFVYNTTAIAIAHGENWVGPGMNEEYYEALTLRLMYYDKGGDAVFYIYARFQEDGPKEVEALCAVNMANANSTTIEDATILKVGNTVTLKYSHKEHNSKYHTYEWNIIEGDSRVSISYVGDTCDVTALYPGVATVTVTYHYSKEEPDVLTGISRTVDKTISEKYHFVVE